MMTPIFVNNRMIGSTTYPPWFVECGIVSLIKKTMEMSGLTHSTLFALLPALELSLW